MASSGDGGFTNIIYPTSSKKQKTTVTLTEETLVDIISQLPESLLVQIISLLPTKDAFRTCILSKRWRYLCTFIHNFKLSCIYDDNVENFVSFVDYVLAHSVSSKIKEFDLNCINLYEYTSQISRWLSFAAEKNVEHFSIRLFDMNPTCTLPESFRTSSSLITLCSRNCPFDFDGVIQWKSLKSLNLMSSVISDDDMVNLLSGCPALECMELYVFRGFSRLEINSLKMKTLKLGTYYCWPNDEGSHSLEIIAPYLQHLEISGGFDDLKCKLLDVSSVVKAKLTFCTACIKDIPGDHGEEFDDDGDDEDSCQDYHLGLKIVVQDYFQKLSYATELTIGSWLIKVLCMLQFKVVAVPELKCRYLKLQINIEKFNLCGVAGLLQALPHVETLNINMAAMHSDPLCHFESIHFAKGDDTIDLQSWISSLVFPNLRNVEIVISLAVLFQVFKGGLCLKDQFDWGFNKLFKLSELLLKAATNLEKYVIISDRIEFIKCNTCSMNCVSLYLAALTEKLLGCPRSSVNSVILFQDLSLP